MSELPSGWVVCQLSDIGHIVTGKTPSTKEPRFYGGKIPFIKPGDLDHSGPVISTEVYLTDDGLAEVPALPPDSIVVTCIGNLGKVGITTKLSASNQQINAVVPDQGVDPTYIFHYCKTLKPWLESESSATTISIVNKGIFSTAPVPLPPLAEQTRIAAKLDELLAQVDTLKARVDAVPALLKRFRQSVLAAAVSGRLTEEWSKEHSAPAFIIKKIGDAFKLIDGDRGPNYPKKEDYHLEGHCLFLSTKNVRKYGFLFDECTFISKEKHQALRAGTLCRGDIIITTRGTLGHVALYDEKVPFDVVRINSGMLILRKLEPMLLNEFFQILIASPSFQKLIDEQRTGSAQPQLPAKIIRGFEVAIPSTQEQTEIVRRVEQLFAFADQLEAKVASAKNRIDHLTQSILAKAFRGELVPQDPNDEPASALLERIQAQRAAAPKAKRGRKASA